MLSPVKALKDRFVNFAVTLRFPRLLLLTLALFAVDFVVPDFIPFADEVLLALLAALLASIRKTRREKTIDAEARVVETSPVARR